MKIFGKDFTIGADPEIFIGDGGSFISAHNLLPGSKQEPHVVKNGAVQVDGMAAEFNIDPASSLEEFNHNLDSVQETLKGMIGDKQFLKVASVEFDEGFTKGIPLENLELGCEADYNGWTLAENPSPEAALNMRTVGGHVHLGGFFSKDPFKWSHFETSARLARILDYTLGVYSVLWDKDDKRRGMYGKAGCFRPKTYGMEYRTLSNSWLFDKKLTKFVYEGVERALVLMHDPDFSPPEEVTNIINTSDRGSSFFHNNPLAKEVLNV